MLFRSIQAAYNKDKWSFQFGFAIMGGGGKCKFDNGLGSFEGVVASIPAQLIAGGINNSLQAMGTQLTGGYSFDPYMRGRQYYYGFTLGSAYKINKNLSVYGGVRLIYGSANYFGYVKNIAFQQSAGGNLSMVAAPAFFTGLAGALNQQAGQLEMAGAMEQIGRVSCRERV